MPYRSMVFAGGLKLKIGPLKAEKNLFSNPEPINKKKCSIKYLKKKLHETHHKAPKTCVMNFL